MKMTFNKLVTPSSTIEVSFDGGVTYKTYNVDSCKSDGITFTEEDCSDLTKIVVKGKFKSFSDTIDVVKQLSSGASNIYPSVVLTPSINYSGTAYSAASSSDDTLISAINSDSVNGYTICDINNNNLCGDLNPTDNFLYIQIGGQPVKFATVTIENPDKIPVNCFYIQSAACDTYVLRSTSSKLANYYVRLTNTIGNKYDSGGHLSEMVIDSDGNYYMLQSKLVQMNYTQMCSTSDLQALAGNYFYTLGEKLADEITSGPNATSAKYEMIATKYYIGTIN